MIKEQDNLKKIQNHMRFEKHGNKMLMEWNKSLCSGIHKIYYWNKWKESNITSLITVDGINIAKRLKIAETSNNKNYIQIKIYLT